MRNLFEGNSALSGWKLEIPRISNDVDLNVVFDIRLVLYFECLFDQNLFNQDTQSLPGVTFERTRALHLRHHFPDAFYQLREGGKASLTVVSEDFPYNQQNPELLSLALAFIPEKNASLQGTDLHIKYPGQTTPVDVTVSNDLVVQEGNLPITGSQSALGEYDIEINETHLPRKDDIADLVLVMSYQYQPVG